MMQPKVTLQPGDLCGPVQPEVPDGKQPDIPHAHWMGTALHPLIHTQSTFLNDVISYRLPE